MKEWDNGHSVIAEIQTEKTLKHEMGIGVIHR